MDTKRQSREIAIIWLSTVLTIIFAAGNIAVAVLCDSMTILLDGLYGLADAVICIVMIAVIRKLHEPPNRKYHFGYAKYEPLLVFVEGVIFATICGSAIVLSAQDLIHPEPVENVRIAVLYSLVSGTVCAGFGLYMKRVGKELNSPLLDANAELTIAEGLISLGICAAFAFSQMMPRASFFSRTEYIDPLMCIGIAILLLGKPLRIISESFRDLLDISVAEEKQAELHHLVSRCKDDYSLDGVGTLKVRKAGRRLFMTVSYVADHRKTLHELEKIREGIAAEIVRVHPGADICIMFNTASPAADRREP